MYTFRFAKRSRMNGPPKLFASRALIGYNLKTCQTEISRLALVKNGRQGINSFKVMVT